ARGVWRSRVGSVSALCGAVPSPGGTHHGRAGDRFRGRPLPHGRVASTRTGCLGRRPDTLREDANAEEDFALGGYRDRVVVELAQNAADAAHRAKIPGRLSLTLDGDRL